VINDKKLISNRERQKGFGDLSTSGVAFGAAEENSFGEKVSVLQGIQNPARDYNGAYRFRVSIPCVGFPELWVVRDS